MTTDPLTLSGIRLNLQLHAVHLENERTAAPSPVVRLAAGKPLSLVDNLMRTLLGLCPAAHRAALAFAAQAAQQENSSYKEGESVAASLEAAQQAARIEAILETVRVLLFDLPQKTRTARLSAEALRTLGALRGEVAASDSDGAASEDRLRDVLRTLRNEHRAVLDNLLLRYNDFRLVTPGNPRTLLALSRVSDEQLSQWGNDLLAGRLEAPYAAVPGALAREAARTGTWRPIRPRDLVAARIAEWDRWLSEGATELGALRALTLPPREVNGDIVYRGVAALETARGMLTVAVSLTGDAGSERVVKLGVLAPTEWSMRQDGIVTHWLKEILENHYGGAGLTSGVPSILGAFDPCADIHYEGLFDDEIVARSEGRTHA